jgi:alpha-beta hydrolase superfamily lysophospholipase
MRDGLEGFLGQMRRRLGITLFILLLLLGLYLGICWQILNVTIIPIRKQPEQTPAELGFSKAEVLSFRSTEDHIPLQGWLVPSSGDKVIVLVHGLHSHAWDCQTPDVVRAYADAGFHVLLFDLRGHGSSGGDRIGLGWLERRDVRAAVNLLLARGFKPGKIGIHGTSYGAATALLATAKIGEIGAVIADSAFASVGDVINGEIERQTGLPSRLAEVLRPGIRFIASHYYSLDLNEVSPEQAIADISPRPILLIHGEEDPIISAEQARRLKAAAGDGAELWLLPGRRHAEGVLLAPDCEQYSPIRDIFLRKITQFFERYL